MPATTRDWGPLEINTPTDAALATARAFAGPRLMPHIAALSLLAPLVRGPRRFFAFGIGTGKTGTTSLAHMLRPGHRVVHEADIRGLGPIAVARVRGRIDAATVRRFLWCRDRRLWLDLESSQVLGLVLPELVATFPEARYICTLRDPRSWLESLVNHIATRTHNPVWRAIGAAQHETPVCYEFTRHDRVLAAHGLRPIEAYLSHYRRHHEGVLALVPPERLMWIHLRDLGPRAADIARFLGIDPANVAADRAHGNAARRHLRLLDLVDKDYLADQIERYTGALVPRLAALADAPSPVADATAPAGAR